MAWPDIAVEMIKRLAASPRFTPEDWVEVRLYEQTLSKIPIKDCEYQSSRPQKPPADDWRGNG